MTALRLRLENLEPDVGPEGREDLGAALSEVMRLSRLVDRLLALARAESVEGPPDDPIDLVPLLADRVATWAPVAHERAIGVVLRPPNGSPLVCATPDRLDQILDNYLANALDASPDGSQITVWVSIEHEGVEVHVVDEGPGLQPEQRDRAFDRMWRLAEDRPARGLGGSGLGLAIVKKLADADGATVRLAGAPGGGLDAIVSIRAARS